MKRLDIHHHPSYEIAERPLQYPEYFTNNESKLSKEDLDKYKKQQALVSQTVKIFEEPTYSDDNPEQSAQVLKLMNEVSVFRSDPVMYPANTIP